MRTFVSYVLLPSLLLAAPALPAQAARGSSPIARWEGGVLPSLVKVSSALAGDHAWGIGMTLSGSWRIHRYVAAEGQVLGAFAPQLNFKDRSTVNSWLPSLSLEVHPVPGSAWDPYVAFGVAHASFSYDEPPAGHPGSTSYSTVRGGLGVRYAITSRLAWRAEFNRQFGSHGASPTVHSGVVFRYSNASVQP